MRLLLGLVQVISSGAGSEPVGRLPCLWSEDACFAAGAGCELTGRGTEEGAVLARPLTSRIVGRLVRYATRSVFGVNLAVGQTEQERGESCAADGPCLRPNCCTTGVPGGT